MKSNIPRTLFVSLLIASATSFISRAATYQEVGGVVVVEAEHFDSRANSTDDDHKFVIAPDELSADDKNNPWGQYQNARGSKYLVSIPDSAGGGQNRSNPDLQVAGPHADYKVQINTTGDYTLYVRDTGYDGSSDSVYFRIVEITSPAYFRYAPTPADGNFDTERHGSTGGWDNQLTPEVNNAGGAEEAATWTISKAGVYTIRIEQREDGNAFDGFVLQRVNLPAPARDIAESPIVGAKPEPLKIANRVPGANSKGTPFNTPIQVSFQDGTTTLDQNSVVVKLDGVAVTTTKASASGITTFTFQPAQIFLSASTHAVSVDYKDNTGKAANDSWTFFVQSYNTIPAGWAVTPDKTKTGFIWRISEVDSVSGYTQNSLARTEAQLAGLLGDNTADSSVVGVATGPGKPGAKTSDPITFEIPDVLNLSKADATTTGNFTPDLQMPGSPGTGGGTDNQAAEVLTFLDLPAGVITMGVNSDDGFRVGTGADVRDAFSLNLGQFDAGRGAADTTFRFVVEKAGVYPFRLIWENGGGDSNIEWFTVDGGTKNLINDKSNAKSIKSYRTGPTGGSAYIKSVSPSIGAQDQEATNTIQVVIVDGSNKINPASVSMTLDGTGVKATANKAGDTTTASFQPTTPFPGGSKHTVTLTFADLSAPPVSRTVNWDFTTRYTEKLFVAGSLFIEAEDFNYGHGQYLKNKAVGMSGKYAGGDYQDLGDGNTGARGDGSDYGIDYNTDHATSPQAVYRPNTPIGAGKRGDTAAPPAAGLDRGAFNVEINHVVGWNDSGDWYNYTRVFPASTNYNVYAHLASGGADENVELAQITGGATTTTQNKTRLGVFKAKATGNWDVWHIVPLQDDTGNPIPLTLGGETTLRLSILPGSNEDIDYIAFVPAVTKVVPPGGTLKFTSSSLKGGNAIFEWTGTGTLQSADDVTGPWTDVSGATSPRTVTIAGNRKFYRLKQ